MSEDGGATISHFPSPVERIQAEIARFGSIGFDRFMELALYGPGGFFTVGRGAGRVRRDFVTSPEVGPLFGACVARAIDREWRELDEPDPFVVIEAGAGSGRLCREVLRAKPACAPALHWVLVEVSPELRDEQQRLLPIEPPEDALGAFVRLDHDEPPEPVGRLGPIVTSLAEMPAIAVDGVVMANELLDNLPFALAEFDGDRWHELRVGSELEFVRAPLADSDAAAVAAFAEVPAGVRAPIPRALGPWFESARLRLRRGVLLAIDYAMTATELSSRGGGWLRTYRDHRRAHHPLVEPGSADITADLVLEQVAAAANHAGFGSATMTTQSEWLRALGIDELVADGDRIWRERAHVGDLAALEARSRAGQAAALTDPSGLGAFTVWRFPAG